MAIIPQTTYSNIPAYPKAWYEASGLWAAKTVAAAADRYTLTSPKDMQIDVGGLSLTNEVAQELDLSVAANWGANVTTRANDTRYELGDVIFTPTTALHAWECTTAGTSASSDPGSWGIAYGDTKADGTALVWTCRFINPTSTNELMVLDVAPEGSGWSEDDTVTGSSSGATSTIISVLSTTAYIISGRARAYKLGEILTNGTDAADQGAAHPVVTGRAGQDFYVYACIGTSITPVIKLSPNSTIPWGYTANTSRKIAGFHCLCLSAGTIASHPADGYLTGDIIPNSVWDLKFNSSSGSNVGLAYVEPLDDWWGIYLLSGTTSAPTSVFGGTILDTQDWNTFVECGRIANMRLPRDAEFQCAASLSNEQTNITGSADPVTTGGHVDTAGRRMISRYFLEDCCGAMYQWLDEQSYQFTGAAAHTHAVTDAPGTTGAASADVAPAWGWYDLPGDFGQLYKQGTYGDVKVIAGGAWNHSTNCGSRCRHLANYRWYANSRIGGRLVARSQKR